ncbi:hypothetical protein [Phnomibacter ginsenosidimutans]|uniref:Uncharacterized protein n=1 Tax=Phnomibacter ginsenosidimutans TaxID=2676868 RepID=A0A6I6GML5_9BACT|nr:hypothetical protein [Phnomibacter ginsenosidimutans]QGW28172.1 hypothetical protein GLV81_08760 [Phnomibacter ginsenosidimutans]
MHLNQQRIYHTIVSYYNFNNNLGLKETPWVKTAYWHQPCKDQIPVYWAGTRWDYNGTTRTPKEGSIACGYFVCTVLKQLGFDIPVVKYSQASSSVMIKALCRNIQRFGSYATFISYMENWPANTAYIVGLDFHTGFLVKTKTATSLLHSYYIYKVGVIKEDIHTADALSSSKSFMVGEISSSQKLLRIFMQH